MLFTPLKQRRSYRKTYPALLMTESCSARWCFQTAPTARSSLVLLLLNILSTYKPPKSKMLPWKRGDGYEPPLFWNCWQLDVPKHCRLAALMQLTEAACIRGQMQAVLPLEKLLQILEVLLYLIFEFLKFWCLGQKSAHNSNPGRTAVPSFASTITTERSQVDLKSKTGTKSSFQTARSETNSVQGTVSYETRN